MRSRKSEGYIVAMSGARLEELIEMQAYQVLARGKQHYGTPLVELIEDRHGLRSTLITSQLPISVWHEYLNDPTVADALLDCITSSAHRLELKGESLRKRNASLTRSEAKK